jgi:hypothetical protein
MFLVKVVSITAHWQIFVPITFAPDKVLVFARLGPGGFTLLEQIWKPWGWKVIVKQYWKHFENIYQR